MNDAEARKIIVKDLNKNLFVVAGAGSGKTSMLVNRMVALIESGVDIKSICAITFTVNAAAEFLERLSKTLKRRSKKGNEIEQDYYAGGLGDIVYPERDEEALRDIDLCFAGTIDSFCNLILSEYPLDAGIPSSSSVIEEDEEKELYKQEFAILSRKKDPLFNDFARIFKNPSEIFAIALDSIVSASYLHLDYVKPTVSLNDFVKNVKEKYENNIKDAIKLIDKNVDLINTSEKSKTAFDKFIAVKNKYLSAWSIDEVINISRLYKALQDISFTSNPSILGDISYVLKSEKARTYSYDKNCTLTHLYNEIEEYKHSVAMEFLLRATNDVRNNLKQKGKLSFNEYLVAFRDLVIKDMLKPDMPIINHIRKRFSHFLLDEAQDTSPFQYELFLYLCSSVPAKRIEEAKLIPGSLFIVGDPKQSIYRFRNADVVSYNRIKNLFHDKDNLVVELSNNFRSSKMLCEYFNEQFETMPGYTPIMNVDNKPSNEGQGLYTFIDEVNVIKTILHNPKYQIIDGKDDEGNPIFRCLDNKDIMVISIAKKQLNPIANKLEEANIPYYLEGNNNISGYPIVETVYAIYCYLVCPNNRDYYYNLLASPLFGYTRDELLFVDDNKLSKKQLEIIGIINKLSSIKNPYILLKNIVERCNLFANVASTGMNAIYYVLGQFEDAYNTNLISSLEDGIPFLAKLLTNPVDKISQLTHKPNAIYLANVHKVKGLEAPVVIIASDTNKNNKSPQKCLDYENNKSYIWQIRKDDGNNSYELNVAYKYEEIKEKESNELKAEKERLKYVGVTRARNYLFINVTSSEWKNMINEKFQEFEIEDSRIENFSNKDKIIKDINPLLVNKESDVANNWNKNKTYHIVLPSKLTLDYNHRSDEIEFNDVTKHDAALKGTLVHAVLEDYVNSNMKIGIKEAVASVINRFQLNGNSEYSMMLEEVLNKMCHGGYVQSDKNQSDLFAILADAEEIMCEVPFAYQLGNQICNGSIDLLYKLKGKYYIVDYKTNYEDMWLEQKYANQLNAYVNALKEISNINAEARIYHIDLR